MQNEKMLVTIGTAVYNGERYLREALDSALAQTYTNFELVISDNASTDKTEEICREYTEKDSRIRYIRQPENRGLHLNCMFIVQEAKGEYFIFLHHDDALKSNFLEEAVSYALSHKNCVIVTSDFEVIDQFGNIKTIAKLESMRGNVKWSRRSREFFKCPMTHTGQLCIYGLLKTKATRKAFIEMPVPKTLSGAELYLISRFATEGQIVSLPLVLRKFRRHSASAYRTELAKFKPKWPLIGRLISFKNRCKIRFYQIKLLMKSNYPVPRKLSILILVHLEYFKSFLNLLFIRIPKKIWSLFYKV